MVGMLSQGASGEESSGRSSERSALQKGLYYLSRRRLSVWEMDQRLLRAEFGLEEREAAIRRLREWGYLDDGEYARAYCRSRKERSSRLKIICELEQKGVARDCVEDALGDVYDEAEELRMCRARMLKEWEKLPKTIGAARGQVWNSLVEKFMARFARHGYPCASIRKIVEEEEAVFFPSYTKET
jgi:regulatory protein